MKKILLSLTLALSLASSAFADSCATGLMPLFTAMQSAKLCSYFSAGTIGVLANNTYLVARNAANSGNLSVLKANGSDNTVLNAGTGHVIDFDINNSPVVKINASAMYSPTDNTTDLGAVANQFKNLYLGTNVIFSSTGQVQYPAPSVMTPSTTYPTPAAGDTLTARTSYVATAAPTAVFVELPLATPKTGYSYTLINKGASPAQIVPISGDSVNATAAGTPYACATTKQCDCQYLTATNWYCVSS